MMLRGVWDVETVPHVVRWMSGGRHNSTRARDDELADGESASYQGAYLETLISVRVAVPKILVYVTA